MKKTAQRTNDGQRRERRAWTAEFKQEAVRLLHERRLAGSRVPEVARELDVRPEQLREWAKQQRDAGAGDGPGRVETPAQELTRLRREIVELRKEREFAKKVAVYFAMESR